MKIVCLTLLLPIACLGQDPNYKASYKAQFANFLDSSCQSSPPIVRVGCQGDLLLVDTSHPSIDCSDTPEEDTNGWSYLECTNACQGDECMDVWKNDPAATLGSNMTYGEILFDCSGDDIGNVDAYTTHQGGGSGFCTEQNAINIHMSRLGVKCGDVYDFDDFFFECASDGIAFNTGQSFYSDDAQSCIDGFVCDINAATGRCDQSFGLVEVRADHEEFQQSCVQSSAGAPDIPDASPPDGAQVDATLEATFKAGWLYRFYGEAAGFDCGSVSGPVQQVRIECVEGTIGSLEREKIQIGCENVDSSSILCSGQDGRDFSELEFLGIVCDDVNAVTHSDRYLECGAKSNQFEHLDDFGQVGTRWTCAEGALFPASTTPSIQVVAAVSIETDDLWATSAPAFCLDSVPTDPTASPVSSPASAPVPVTVVERDSNAGAIVGGVLGCLAIIMVAVVLIVYFKLQNSRGVGQNAKPKDLTDSEGTVEKEVELAVHNSTDA